jgi:hypothetical protein
MQDWKRRQSLAWGFAVSMLVLIATSELLLPGWVGGFLRVAHAYTQYTFGRSVLDLWFTPRIGPIITAGMLLACLALCWRYAPQPADSPGFFVVISLALAATLVVIPTLAPHTQLLLLPGFLCMYHYHCVLWRSNRVTRFMLLAAWLLLAWPWIAATGLAVAAVFGFPVSSLLRWWELPLYTSPMLPLAVLSVLVCAVRVQPWISHQDLAQLSE